MHFARTQAHSNRIPSGNRFVAPVVLCAIFLAGSLPLILAGYERGRGATDQGRFHLRAIQQFARQWPRLDLRNYLSATTPGYHIVVGLADRYLGDDHRVLRLVGLLFTLGLIATFGATLARRVAPGTAVALGLPLLCSLYVFSSGTWLLPDNAAWWGILVLLLLALDWRDDWAHYAMAAVVLVLAVLARQINIWAAGMLWVAVWLGPFDNAQDRQAEGISSSNRGAHVALILLCTVPGALVLAYFITLWQGVVPPPFQPHGTQHVALGTSYSGPAFTLALLGLFGPFFLVAPVSRLARTFGREGRPMRLIAAAILLGAIIGLMPATSYDYASGRFSGIWNVVHRLPVIAHRSPLIVVLAALGGGILAVFCLVLERRERTIFLAALVLFVATQFANKNAWQRYYEPFVLMMLGVMTSRTIDPSAAEPDRRTAGWRMSAGPVILSILLAIVTFASLR